MHMKDQEKSTRGLRHCMLASEKNIIQGYLNSSTAPSKLNSTFHNQAPLQPIIASEPMEILEADLVDLRTHPQQNDGKTYKYVLAVIDVFSRYVEILL